MTIHIIALAGGSGSGKTTLAYKLLDELGAEQCTILGQDCYFTDCNENYDHPNSLDFALLEKHLQSLKEGVAIDAPIYDFATHVRSDQTQRIEPVKYMILEGTMVLSQANLYPYFSLKVFLEVPEAIRYSRRLQRDILDRGATPEEVHERFWKQVKPMHDKYVEPATDHADLIMNDDTPLQTLIDLILNLKD